MAKFSKKLKDGRIIKFDIASYEQLTGSADFAARRRLIRNKQRIPFAMQRGDQSKGFKKADIQAPSPGAPVIIKLDEDISYTALPKANYKNRVLRELRAEITGASNRRGQDIPATVFNELESRISDKFTQLPEVIMILSEDTPFTGSYSITSSEGFPGVPAYTSVANSSGYVDWNFQNSSPTATGATWSFANSGSTFVDGENGIELHQAEYTSSFIIRTYATGSHTGSFVGQVSIITSQSRIDSGKFEYYNNTASSNSGFNRTVIKSKVFGDGNETLFSASFENTDSEFYAADRELLTFPYDTIVASGTFDYGSNFTHLAFKGSSTVFGVTLYWPSGSGGVTQPNGISGSLSGSVNIVSGSHIFLNPELTMPASGGYYSTMNLGTTSSPVGYTIHLAGDGILGVSTAGDLFDNPFLDSYDSTKKVIPAATRWNGQSFTKTS